jgi:hypothetical protein
MKKILGVILLTAVVLSPLACGKNLSPTSTSMTPTPTITSTPVSNWDIVGPVTITANSYNLGYVHIYSAGSLWLAGPSGAVTNAAVTLNLSGDFVMDAAASVIGDSAGYGLGAGPGAGGVYAANAGGGGHGGAGGIGGLAAAGIANDDSAGPTLMGSGGTVTAGGALLRVNATSASLNGSIQMNGNSAANGSAGAGGTIYIQANTIFGSGNLQAFGGGAITPNTGGGGGGIITLSVHSGYYFTGTTSVIGGTAVSSSDDGANGFFTQTGY